MGQKADASVSIRGFAGMVSNEDARDLEGEQAAVQMNMAILRKNALVVRRGMVELEFDSEDT